MHGVSLFTVHAWKEQQCVWMQGWDKTYCLQFVEKEFGTIHFFGDKTYKVMSD